ncbi:hypothetical protein KY362_06185 [Candidatus Woesearchaeota archaeon]|nr:hypothetical protein [Candidatus Woesearchaeota archaeon]
MSGCANKGTPDQKVKSNSKQTTVREQTPEEVLAREVADGKLVEVYDEYIRLGLGESAQNWMIINNVLDKDEEFRIYPCAICTFETTSVKVPAGEYKIIGFKVSASEGQMNIRVKDSFNNAYGYASISVIVD